MSDTSSGDAQKPMEQSDHDLSEAMENLSGAADNSDKTSTPNLSDMPLDVAGLIIERSEYKEKLTLRKVSKSLRSLVDKQKPACKSVKFIVSTNQVGLWFDNRRALYMSPNFNIMRKKEEFTVVKRDDYEKVAFDDLTWTLKNPNLQLEKFEYNNFIPDKLSSIIKTAKQVPQVLKSLNRQLSVRTCTIYGYGPADFLTVLPYLKPGVLEKISIGLDPIDWSDIEVLIGMEQVASLDQWKQAVELEFDWEIGNFPLTYATNFKRFIFNEWTFEYAPATRIINFLTKLDNFEHCVVYLKSYLTRPNFADQFKALVPRSSNSNYEWEFKAGTEVCCVEIDKKKREENC